MTEFIPPVNLDELDVEQFEEFLIQWEKQKKRSNSSDHWEQSPTESKRNEKSERRKSKRDQDFKSKSNSKRIKKYRNHQRNNHRSRSKTVSDRSQDHKSYRSQSKSTNSVASHRSKEKANNFYESKRTRRKDEPELKQHNSRSRSSRERNKKRRNSREQERGRKIKYSRERGNNYRQQKEDSNFQLSVINQIKEKTIEQDLEKRLIKAKMQAEEAQKEDCTVMLVRINLKVEEKDIFDFFVNYNVVPVRDVRIIRDQKTGKSKSVAYVEFYTPEAVLKAVSLSGQMLKGQACIIQPSQAEKNRAANVHRQVKQQQQNLLNENKNTKIMVSGLLSQFQEKEIRKLFSDFGEIKSVEIQENYVLIDYFLPSGAANAIKRMNNMEMGGRRLKVEEADPFYEIKAKEKKQKISQQPTQIILIQNMINQSEAQGNSEYLDEIYDQVWFECQKCGRVDKVIVKKEGDIWVRFDTVTSASKAMLSFNNKVYGGMKCTANYANELAYLDAVRILK